MKKINQCDIPLGPIDTCQICQSDNLQDVIDLGFSAPCDSLLTKEQLRRGEKIYPLHLVRCRDCGLVQIDYAVDPSELFHPDYPYRSGITETLRKNLHKTSSHVANKMGIQSGSLVIDIGSNDGTVLEGFKSIGMKTLGVEPTKIANIARANGIDTINDFFTEKTALRIAQEYGKASLMTAANVFAHINNLSSLLNGVHHLLVDNGVFVSESHYMMNILETLQYDSIYHEHLRFYLIKPLIRLFHDHGFTLIDAEPIPNYGGSIRVYARKGTEHTVSENVAKLITMEEKSGAYKEETYQKFSQKIENARKNIRSLIVRINDEGKKVVGIGCPGRAVTLLTHCGLTSDLLPYIAEQSTSLKLGLFTPSTHIPVIDEKRMFDEQPDYGLMLSWHYAEPIIKNLRARGLRSKIIVPLPEIRIVK